MKLSFGLLCSFLISSFIMVYADNENDFFKYCERACNYEFLPKLVNILNTPESSVTPYDGIESYWNECQYRCYRCHLRPAVRAMDYLKNMYKIQTQNLIRSRVEIATIIDRTDMSLRSCYSQWKEANKAEDFESKFE